MEQRLINALSSPLVKRPRNRQAGDGGGGAGSGAGSGGGAAAAPDPLAAAHAPPAKQPRLGATASGVGGGAGGSGPSRLSGGWPAAAAGGGAPMDEEAGGQHLLGLGGTAGLALGQGLPALSNLAPQPHQQLQARRPHQRQLGALQRFAGAPMGLEPAWSAASSAPGLLGMEAQGGDPFALLQHQHHQQQQQQHQHQHHHHQQPQQQPQQQQQQQVAMSAAASLQAEVQAALPPGCQVMALMCAEPSLGDAPALATAALVFSTPSGATGAALWHAGRMHAVRRFATPSQAADHCEALLEVAIALMRGGAPGLGLRGGLPLGGAAGLLPGATALGPGATLQPSAAPSTMGLLSAAAAAAAAAGGAHQQGAALAEGAAAAEGGEGVLTHPVLLAHLRGAAGLSPQLFSGGLPMAGPGEGLAELAAAAAGARATAQGLGLQLGALRRSPSAASGPATAQGSSGTGGATGGTGTPRSASLVAAAPPRLALLDPAPLLRGPRGEPLRPPDLPTPPGPRLGDAIGGTATRQQQQQQGASSSLALEVVGTSAAPHAAEGSLGGARRRAASRESSPHHSAAAPGALHLLAAGGGAPAALLPGAALQVEERASAGGGGPRSWALHAPREQQAAQGMAGTSAPSLALWAGGSAGAHAAAAAAGAGAGALGAAHHLLGGLLAPSHLTTAAGHGAGGQEELPAAPGSPPARGAGSAGRP